MKGPSSSVSGSTKRPERAAAVVGAGGFLGTHLCQALRLGGYPVITLQAGQEMPCDVTTVFFVAGRVTPANATESADLVAAELAAFRQTLDAAHCAGRSRRVVLASSGGTLYAQSCQPPYREGHPVAPNNAYGAMKLAMESMLLARGGIEPVAVRLANLYGPGQRARRGLGVVAHWIDALGAGRSITVLGEPDSTRDYLYSDDAVNLFVRLHSASQVPAVVNAGSGAPTTLAELARLMLDAAQCTNRQIHYAPSRAADRMHVWLSIDLAHATVGWAPLTTLPIGLARTWAYGNRSLPHSQRTPTACSSANVLPGIARPAGH